LNACHNCVDRHLPDAALKRRKKRCRVHLGRRQPDHDKKITYGDLKDETSRLANALKARGVKKGDRVTSICRWSPKPPGAMLACARIGAVHSVVFGGFSPGVPARPHSSIAGSKVVITADEGLRGGQARFRSRPTPTEALKSCSRSSHGARRSNIPAKKPTGSGRDHLVARTGAEQSTDCPCEWMNAEDPLFILYTSGSTGKPKGVLHTTGGYLVYAALTHKMVFDYRDGEIYWCTADVGWVTGPLLHRLRPAGQRRDTVIFEGVPTYPDWSRFWQVVDKHKVNIFYTAPTAIRSLIAQAGDAPVKKVLAQIAAGPRLRGRTHQPEIWRWYHDVVGEGRCPWSTHGGRPKRAAT
jgi:acetyl-CoA synthetase